MASPLGVPYLAAPDGELELGSISVENSYLEAGSRPGQIIALDTNRLDIVCNDGILIARAGYLAGVRLDVGLAAQRLGLQVGSLV